MRSGKGSAQHAEISLCFKNPKRSNKRNGVSYIYNKFYMCV